jgi:hypothetical protein
MAPKGAAGAAVAAAGGGAAFAKAGAASGGVAAGAAFAKAKAKAKVMPKAKAKAKVRARAARAPGFGNFITPRLFRTPRILVLLETGGWTDSAEHFSGGNTARVVASYLIQCSTDELHKWITLMLALSPPGLFIRVKHQYDVYMARGLGNGPAWARGAAAAAWAVMPSGVVAGPET